VGLGSTMHNIETDPQDPNEPELSDLPETSNSDHLSPTVQQKVKEGTHF
jgi:hypothetical protein